MTAWILNAALATLCFALIVAVGFLLWLVRTQREGLAMFAAQHEKEMAAIRLERDTMMRTALEARGIQVVNASEPSRQAVAPPPSPFARLATKAKELEEQFAKQAQDRDERLRSEFEAKVALGGESGGADA